MIIAWTPMVSSRKTILGLVSMAEDLFDQRRAQIGDRRPGRLQRALAAGELHREAIQLAQQVCLVFGLKVHQASLQRLAGRSSCGRFDGAFSQVYGSLAAPLGERAHRRLEDIPGLGGAGRIQLLTFRTHRAGCSDGCFGSHGGRVPRQGDHGPGAASHGAARRDINHHRDSAGADALYHVLHQVEAAAGRIQLEDQQLSAIAFSQADAALQVF